MSLKLPALDHPARELFDVADLAQRAAPGARHLLPTLRDAQSLAGCAFANTTGVRAVTYFVHRANGDIHLMTFGPLGGFRTVWNFGK